MNKFAYYLCLRGCIASLWLVSFIYLIAIEGEVRKISHFGTLLLIEAGLFAKELVSFLKQRNAEKHHEDIRLTDLILLCITLGAAMTVVCFWGYNEKYLPLIIIDFVVYFLLIILGFIYWILAKKAKKTGKNTGNG